MIPEEELDEVEVRLAEAELQRDVTAGFVPVDSRRGRLPHELSVDFTHAQDVVEEAATVAWSILAPMAMRVARFEFVDFVRFVTLTQDMQDELFGPIVSLLTVEFDKLAHKAFAAVQLELGAEPKDWELSMFGDQIGWRMHELAWRSAVGMLCAVLTVWLNAVGTGQDPTRTIVEAPYAVARADYAVAACTLAHRYGRFMAQQILVPPEFP